MAALNFEGTYLLTQYIESEGVGEIFKGEFEEPEPEWLQAVAEEITGNGFSVGTRTMAEGIRLVE